MKRADRRTRAEPLQGETSLCGRQLVRVERSGAVFGKKARLRSDKPAIDIRKKPVKGLFGTKWVRTTREEQRQLKAVLLQKYPDRYFVDDLREWNSVTQDLSWIDRLEEWDILFGEDW